jgi:hypothetical protein
MTEEEQIAAQLAAEMGTTPAAPPPPAIDYAKLYAEQQAQNVIMQQQISQSLAAQQQLIAQQQQSAQQPNTQPDPYAAFAPDTAAAMRAVADNIQKGFEQKLAQRDQQFTQLQQETAFAGAASKHPAAIVERAKQIFAGMAKNGTPLNTADAVRFAVGEAVEAGTYAPMQRQLPPSVIPGGSRQPVTTGRPANFDTLPWKQQEAALVAMGIENEEF